MARKIKLSEQNWLGKRFPFDKINFSILQSYFATINPAQAAILLKQHNITNRQKIPNRSKRYASDIAMGLFVLNGEPIIFDTNASLMNGQHRLQGCVDSNVDINVVLTFGIEPKAMATIDTGKTRSFGDFLKLEEESNCAVKASTSKLLLQFASGGQYKTGGHQPITTGALKIVFYEFKDDLEKWVAKEQKLLRIVLQPSEGLFLLVILSKINAIEKKGIVTAMSGVKFLESIAFGENLKKTDLIYKLRDWLLKKRVNRRKLKNPVTTNVILNTVIKVFNHMRGVKIESDDFVWDGLGGEAPQMPEGLPAYTQKRLRLKIGDNGLLTDKKN